MSTRKQVIMSAIEASENDHSDCNENDTLDTFTEDMQECNRESFIPE